MKRLTSWQLVLFVGAFTLSGLWTQAEFIQPVAVVASNGQATQDALINGLGFDDLGFGSPAAVHAPTAAELWLCMRPTMRLPAGPHSTR